MATDFNFSARHPFNLLPYQEAGRWIEEYRQKFKRWPTAGKCPPEGVSFSPRTFRRALADMKALDDLHPKSPFSPE